MPDDRYRFTIGDFECLAIKDTTAMIDTHQLFHNVDKTRYTNLLQARDENPQQAELSHNVLAVFSDDWVLIDTGIGTLDKRDGQVAEILDDEEIRPEHIILTHAHADHYGGLMTEDGSETFGNTPVYICQNEWITSVSGDYADHHPRRAQMLEQYLLPVERQIERIECLNMNEILPGFSVLQLPGHTMHHIGILIESRNQRLIVAADALIHPLHLENLDWRCGFDTDHEQARASRVELAELALELDALVMAYHFPFPGLGRIEREGTGYRWQAIVDS
ncbi:MAG: MBL fold metallo-hydrolase [Anaerolineae bacterium]